MSANPARKCLAERQAAEYLGFAPATLRQSRHTGKLAGVCAPKHIKLGRSVRYYASDLDTWLKSTEVSA
ncbi:DNA-binding protein [Vreelandella rituensis]|uniref:DNA-binding protein n=1 Tax=Vreelandella rituensis TaxID=2282306 RepID=A0A368U0E8_9GAMM|nr:DNA-binding protein [Halomonas rituensis]